MNYLSIVLRNIRYYYENLAIYYSHYDYSFFNMLSQQQHINIQIRYSIDTLRLMGKPVYGIFYTHIAQNKMVYQILLLYIL